MINLLWKVIRDTICYTPGIIHALEFLYEIYIPMHKNKEHIMTDAVVTPATQTDTDLTEIELEIAVCFDIAVAILKARKAAVSFSPAQLVAFLNDPQFLADIGPSLSNLSQNSVEGKNFTATKGLELAGFIVKETGKIVAIYS